MIDLVIRIIEPVGKFVIKIKRTLEPTYTEKKVSPARFTYISTYDEQAD